MYNKLSKALLVLVSFMMLATVATVAAPAVADAQTADVVAAGDAGSEISEGEDCWACVKWIAKKVVEKVATKKIADHYGHEGSIWDIQHQTPSVGPSWCSRGHDPMVMGARHAPSC